MWLNLSIVDFHLLKPSLNLLPSYRAALETGWSPDNLRLEKAAQEELAQIAADPGAFVINLDRFSEHRGPFPNPAGPPIQLPDGSEVERLPGFRHWMWDGEFCGSIGFRWQPGTPELPAHVMGHIGYAVVPWKRGKGYATAALRLMLDRVKRFDLPYVELTADPDNLVSQKVILANGGTLVRSIVPPYGNGWGPKLLFRINL